MSTKRKTVAFLFATLIIIVAMATLALFWDDISGTVFADSYVSEGEPDFTEADGERDYIFLTYSSHKLGDYNFWEDCYAKAEAAVEDGRADSVMEYIMDTDFDHDALKKARAAVEAGDAESVLEYMHNHPDSGKLAFVLHFDPMFAGTFGCYLDQKGITGDSKILYAEQDLAVAERPDAAVSRFISNPEEWEAAIARIASYLWAKDNAYAVKDLDNYTSSMYALSDDDGIPSVVVRNTTNAGGHFVVISYKDGSNVVELKFRLECGYQPVEIPNWEPEISSPPVDDNPPAPPTTEQPPTTEITPPTPEPKDPEKDITKNPQAPDYDFYSSDPNQENSTEQTKDPEPEKNNPDEYKAPDPPTEAPTEQPTTEQPSVPDTTDSGSKIIDDSNGQDTTAQNGKPATTTAGDGQDHGNYTDQTQNNPQPTEEPFKNTTTSGDLDESQVE